MPQLPYVTLNVFTTEPLTSGNPLAIVSIPPDTTLSKTQEHLIAREFGYSETIFIYPSSSLPPEKRGEYTKIAIWTVKQEIPFAGHPTVGAGWYLGGDGEGNKEGELLIPAGRLKYEKDAGGRVRIDTPHKVTLWERMISRGRIGEVIGLPYEYFGNDEERVFENSTVGVKVAGGGGAGVDGWDVNGIPVVSIVDGMTFALVEVKSVSVLQALKVGRKGVVLDTVVDLGATGVPGGRTFLGIYCYTILEEKVEGGKGSVKVRSRMFFDGDGEDPATGSAACALGSFLAIVKGGSGGGRVGEWEFEVTQGVEMGRRSEIGVRVLLEEGGGGVRKVYLEGEAVKVMEGVLTV
ncbi:hypothetical protein TWF718_009540 [Orbilia javanica]|uniref:Diaminopimelate epimerase-like protein n=1 Tax=Orbilia javanica TaxID=47235 RepID=A0AAN8MVV2_9PEZI